MKILVAAILALLVVSPVSAYTIPPGLAASQAVVQHGAPTAIVDVAQTGGATTTLKTVNTCYAGTIFAGTQQFSWVGSAELTFSTGPRKAHGVTLTPDHCWVQTFYQINGNLIVVLADNTDTLP